MYFQLYRDHQYQYRWRLKASNGDTLADSGEGYHNKQDCLNTLLSIKQHAALAPIVDSSTNP